MFDEFSQSFEVRGSQVLGFMRVRANGGVDPIVLLGERNGGIEPFRTRPRPNRKYGSDASRASPLEHGVAILSELREINMGVRVN
jgi:hypothetical protein